RHHEQQVLGHVHLQEQGGERLDRRGQGEEDRGQPAQEGGGPAGGPARGVPAGQDEPAAQVDRGGQGERNEQRGVERPGAQEGVERRAHGCGCRATEPVAGSAGGCPCGRRLVRNSARTAISAAFICLPYAGMLPPPGVPLLTWSMSWSFVSRVPTVVRSGPRSPPTPSRAWQLRQLLFWETAPPWICTGVAPLTAVSGTGSPLPPGI